MEPAICYQLYYNIINIKKLGIMPNFFIFIYLYNRLNFKERKMEMNSVEYSLLEKLRQKNR